MNISNDVNSQNFRMSLMLATLSIHKKNQNKDEIFLLLLESIPKIALEKSYMLFAQYH